MHPSQLAIPDRRCQLCPLGPERDRRRGQVIRGRGPANSQVVVVGQGGGAEEEASGKPFVGPAGQRLQKQFDQAGLDIKSVFYTNVVLCREPNNRVPTKEEMELCHPFVDFELTKVVRPKWIIAAGAVAFKYFGGQGTITDSVGHPFQSEQLSCWVMPILHPSSFLHKESPLNEERVINALVYVRNALQGKPQEKTLKTKCTVYETLTDVAEWSDKTLLAAQGNGGCYLSVDTETSSLSPELGTLLCVSSSLKDGEGDVVPLRGERGVDYWSPRDYNQVLKIIDRTLTTKGVNIIGANFKFDALFFRAAGITCAATIDVELAHHLLDENSPHGLDDLSYFVGMGGYKRILKPYLPNKKTPYTEVPLETLWYYAAMDADCTRRLWFWRFAKELAKDGRLLWLFNHITMPLQRVLTDVEYRGISIDLPYIDKLRHKYVRRLEEMDVHFHSLPEVKETLRRINKGRRDNAQLERVNFQAGDQLRVLLFDVLKLQPVKLTKTGKASTDKGSLLRLAGAPEGVASEEFTEDDVVYLSEEKPKNGNVLHSLLEYRALSKLLSTYIDGLEEQAVDGVVHTSFLIHVPRTGRSSSRNPNLQNIPGDMSGYHDEIRNIFIARPGYKLAELDYKSAEIRCWAHYSQDRILLADLAAGVDIHRQVAAEAYGVPMDKVTAQQRTIAKSIVFGTIYGRGSRSIATQFGISEEEARRIQQLVLHKYSTAAAWIYHIQEVARRDGYVRNAFGRVRRLGLLKSTPVDARGRPVGLSREAFGAYNHTLNEAVNTPIQGMQADITWTGMICNWEAFRSQQLDAHIVLTVHDNQLIEYKATQERRVLAVAVERMEAAIPGVKVPLKVDVSTGYKWGSLEKYRGR